MIHAYDEMYLNWAMKNLGDAFDYVVNVLEMDKDDFLNLFISTGIADEFGNGNVSFILGMSGAELVQAVLHKVGINIEISAEDTPTDYKEYWCGWELAYYQWYTKRCFSSIAEHIVMKDIEALYPTLHEAGDEKFVDVVEEMIHNQNKPTRLQELRKKNGYSQSMLAMAADVSLRSIQMYEQRNKDINKAQVGTLSNLARVLGCHIEDLME